MKAFKQIFDIEFKRVFSKAKTVIMISFFIICLTFIQIGINQYKRILENKEKFQEFEKIRVSQYTTITQYGAYGFRMIFIPSKNSIFFSNSGIFSHVNAFIDSGIRLKIYNSLKGYNLFKNNKLGSDFSGVILLIGSLLLIFYGFGTLSKRSYLKLLVSLYRCGKAYFLIVASRLIIISLAILIIFVASYFLMMLNNIKLEIYSNIMYFFIIILMISWLFFLIGVAIGTTKRKGIGILAILITWFLLIYFIPTVINTYIGSKAENMTSVYEAEIEKLKILMQFERKVIDKVGRLKENEWNKNGVHELYKSYLENEFKQILEKEERMITEMKNNISQYQLLSIFFPPTFYLSVSNEISSSGFKNMIGFYNYSKEMKVKFFLYYAKKKYFSNHAKVESFIKGDENVFYSKSSLPFNFWPGVGLTFLYIVSLLGYAYRKFKRQITGEAGKIKGLEINIKPGKLNYLLTRDEGLKNQVFNYFTGKGQRFINVKIDGQEPERRDFVYLPDTKKLPNDISKKALYKLLFKQKLKERYKKWEILIDYAFEKEPTKIIILNDFFKNLRNNEIEEIKREIESKALVSLYISGDYYQALSIADNVFFSLEDRSVDALKEINDSKEGKI
jgi:hypothetical protein